MSDIQDETSLGQAAIRSAINGLLMKKLVEERRGDRNAREFKLNKKGMEATEAIKKLTDVLKE